MKRLIFTSDSVFGMSNMLGKNIKLDGPLEMSFYFGSKHAGVPNDGEIPHSIRVKIFPNPEKFREAGSFYMELHGDYNTSPNNVSSSELKPIRRFFQKYKVLFAGAWEEAIVEDDITAYFRHRIDLEELIQGMPEYAKYKEYLDTVHSISEFEQIVRTHNIFSMND